MSKPQIVIENVPPERFEIIQKNISNQLGVILVGPSGEAEKFGIKISWAYDANQAKLVLTVEEKPFYVPEGTVEEKLREACQ